MAKQKYWDGTAWVQVAPSMEEFVDGGVHYADDTGTANAKVVTVPVAIGLKKGVGVAFTNLVQNTGPVTININGLGAKSVLKSNGGALANGNLKANSVYTVRYNGTAFILQGEGGEYGTAVAADVRAGKTIGTEDGIVTGTMPSLIVSPGDIVILSADKEVNTSLTSFTKMKEITTRFAGTVRVKFDLWTQYGGWAYGRIYVNGVAKGLQRSTNAGAGSTYSEDLVISSGDTVQLYLYGSGGGYATSSKLSICMASNPHGTINLG